MNPLRTCDIGLCAKHRFQRQLLRRLRFSASCSDRALRSNAACLWGPAARRLIAMLPRWQALCYLAAALVPVQTSAVVASLAEAVPTSLPEVMARFQYMQKQVDSLTDEVKIVQDSIAEVEGAATSISGGVAAASSRIAAMSLAAASNAETARRLRFGATATSAAVAAAEGKTKNLQKILNGLESTALELSGSSSEVAKQAAALQAKVEEILPGAGTVNSRMDHIESTLKRYEQETAGDKLDVGLAKALKTSFRRAAGRVNDLTEEVRAAQIKAEDAGAIQVVGP
eukprot:TRINITY_DN5465_c0_g1_i1.p1 TRINITY_DN5465_c0_g1~~TRINITY_DN5465_c0_g1_i1.p1  ORF type:complete len:285 (+),score=72.66 TRINITY_DN5465_c0_g1_i1:656-1510(+)